jgi:POLQ-like helicase
MPYMRELRMKFEKKSSHLLSITKAKAKMFEFGLGEEHHLTLHESPSRLLLMTIGILADYCNEILDANDRDDIKKKQSYLELRNVARYFDALLESKLESVNDYYLLILAAAAYYLADMPGSAMVLSQRLEKSRKSLTDSGVEFILEHVLNIHTQYTTAIFDRENILYGSLPDFKEGQIPLPDLPLFMSTIRQLRMHYQGKELEGHLALAKKFQRYFLDHGSDRELLIANVIAAMVVKRVNSSAITLLPEYTGVSREEWLPTLAKSTSIKEFWPAQRLLGEAGIFKGRSAVVQLPTSAGKTKSVEIVIRSSFMAGRSSVAVVIAPFRSLCREISESLSIAFSGEDVYINQLNDIPQIDESDTEFFLHLFEQQDDVEVVPSIIVSTPEKLVYLLRHKPELTSEISLVIYDEGHQFDTGARGVTYELLLSNFKQELKPDTQHVLISAVLSNAKSIGDWLYADDGTVVNGSNCLSTERSIAFSSWRTTLGQFHYVEPHNPNSEEFYVPRVLESFPIPKKLREKKQKYFPDKHEKTSIAAYLGLKLSSQGPVAIFCGTKKTVSTICKLIVASTERIPQLPIPLTYSDSEEVNNIANLAAAHLGDSSAITQAIRKGVLPHSAGTPNGLRIAVEFAMEKGLGRCVVCTSTLAQGVNLPIKYLIVSGVFQGQRRISTRDFHNLLGRAGRSGKHTEGSIIFTDTELFDERKSTKRWHWNEMSNLLDPSRSEQCTSSLLTLAQPFMDDPFNVDPIKFIKDPDKYQELCKKAADSKGLDISILLMQMQERKGYIKSIESYLLAHASDEVDIDEEKLAQLCSHTFAFSLATTDEKKKLAEVFRFVALTVNAIEPRRRPIYGKALLGIEELHFIEEWISENLNRLNEQSDILAVLDIIWPVLMMLASDNNLKKLIGEDAGLFIARLWCSGISYYEILSQVKLKGIKFKAGQQVREITIENILEICDSSLSYDAMLVVGACADLLPPTDELANLENLIRHLQASIKIGLQGNLDVWLYSHGLADRVVAAEIADVIVRNSPEILPTDISIFTKLKHVIEPKLSMYPSVFSNSIYK